jgi:PTS hybrid protein
MVGIVVVSHSRDIAVGTTRLAAQMAGPDVSIQGAGGTPDGGLGTDAALVSAAIEAADSGDGVVVTVRAVLEAAGGNGHVRLLDAPLVEGAVAAAVTASAGLPIDDVARAAEEARAIPKL